MGSWAWEAAYRSPEPRIHCRKRSGGTTGPWRLHPSSKEEAIPVIAGGRSLVALVILAAVMLPARPGHSQTVAVAAGTGPTFLPGSGASTDWQGLLWFGIQKGPVGGRLEAMYTGVPGADLVALTANLVYTVRRQHEPALEPYLVAGLGSYVKFSEDRFGLNAGGGLRRRVGRVRVFAEIRYHRVLRQFDEARATDTLVPLIFGITLGH